MSFIYQANHADTWDWAGTRVAQLLAAHPLWTTILDIGPGWGKYRLLLPQFPAMDAVEAFQPYVDQCGLGRLYRHIWVADVCDWVRSADFRPYHVVIMGDVLEHIETSRAQGLLAELLGTCGEVIAVVPYRYVQGAEHGNEHQRHLQDDLTIELMRERYPALKLVDTEYRGSVPYKGLYRS